MRPHLWRSRFERDQYIKQLKIERTSINLNPPLPSESYITQKFRAIDQTLLTIMQAHKSLCIISFFTQTMTGSCTAHEMCILLALIVWMFLCIFLSLCNGMFVYSRCTVIVNFRIHDCVIDFRILIGQNFTSSMPHGGKLLKLLLPSPDHTPLSRREACAGG